MKQTEAALVGLMLLIAAPAFAADGKTIYIQVCAACHTTGVAGAPKLGDKSAWTPRMSNSREVMIVTVLKGKGVMPPKGGNASLTDSDARAAMDYMLSQVE